MTTALQIQDVPVEIHDALVAEARRQDLSMQSYLLGLVTREALLDSHAETFAQAADIRIDVEKTGLDIVAIIREGRG